jgi:ATP-dependent Zn protease
MTDLPRDPSNLDRSLEVVTEHTTLVAVSIPEAAVRHLAAWDTDQRVRALHEAGHVVVGHVLGIPIKGADIRGHYRGFTETGDGDDDQPQTQTASRMLDQIVVRLAGQAAEKMLIGEGTDNSRWDLEQATSIALERINCGLDPRAPFMSIDALPGSRPPEAIWNAVGETVVSVLAESRTRADALAAEHREAIVSFAQQLHDARRLTDGALEEALRNAGFDW